MAGLTFDDLDSSAPLSEDEAQGALNLAAGGAPVTITSGYRTPEHNAEIGGAPNSLHTRGGGQATDFVLPPGVDPASVRSQLEEQGYPVSEWLVEKRGDAHSTGDHIHWGWGPKGQPASGPVNFSDLDGGANTPTPSKGVSGPVSFDDLEPDPSWGAVLGAQFRTTWDRWKAMAGAAVQAIAENAPTQTAVPNVNPFGQGIAEVPETLTPAQKAQTAKDAAATAAWGHKVFADAQQHIAETVPQMAPGSVKDYAAKITAGVIDLVPVVAAGMATDNPVIPAALMGGTAAAQTYGAARAAGRTPQQAGMDATFTGMVNGALGTLPIGVLMKPGQTFLGKVLQGAGSFGAFSVVTEALQIGYDKGLVTPNMTLAQAWQRLKDAGITGTLTGAILGAGHGGLEAAVGRYHVTGPQKPVQPRVEPTASPSAAAPSVAPIPRPAPKRADLLAKAAIPEPGPKEPAAAATGPAEPFFKPEDLEQPGFKTTPAKIAEEHAAEVSHLEAEGAKAAGEKHTPEVLKPGYEPEAPAAEEKPVKKPKPEPEEPPPPPPENPYVVRGREVKAKYGLAETVDTEDRAALVKHNNDAIAAMGKTEDPEERDILGRTADWARAHVESIDHTAQMERAQPVADLMLPRLGSKSNGRTPIAHINIMFDPESGKYGVQTQHDFSGFSGGGGPVSGRAGLAFDFDNAQEALDYAKAQLGRKTDTGNWGTSANKRAYDEAAALGKWLPNVKLPSGEPPSGATPPTPAQGDLFAPIGNNAGGKVLYEDKNGVRSYLDGNVRVNEPVQMRPTRGGVQMVIDHTAHPEFATAEELPNVPAPSLPEPVAEPAPSDHPRALQLADVVAQRLQTTSTPITAKQLQAAAESVYGGTLASGAVPRDEMYDAAELGLNGFLRSTPSDAGHGPFSPVVDMGNAVVRAKFIESLKDRLPTQTVRAGEKETMQQFSTPPDYAYAATWAADLHPSDVVLEPSGGTGSFVTHALNAGVREVHANDLSDRRADMLRSLNPTNVTQENAENIDILLPEGVNPTVVLMNPPFSQTAGRLGTKKTLGIDAVHVEAALKRMQPGGRLVAILGGGTTFNRGFWKRIAANYDIRANIGVEGKIYRKYGTTFPTRLVVIDKNPPSGRPIVELNEVKDAAGIIRALEKVRGERVHLAGEQAAPEPAGPPLAGAREGAVELGAPVPDATGIVGAGEGDRGARPIGAAERPTGPGAPLPGGEGQPVEGAGARVPVAAIEPERPVTEGAGGHVGEPVAGSQEPLGSGGGGAGDGILPDGSGQRVDPGVTEAPILVAATEISLSSPTSEAPLSDAVYEPYTPQRVKITGAKEHPGALVQSAAMASVLPPVPKYNLATPLKVITEGRLSDAQLEAVVYAGHAHSAPFLPESDKLPERRRGFFIGDGTGVGKGREIAGIIQDNWERGTRKHIWVSEKQSLINDAKRDMQGVGLDPKKAFPHNGVKPADAIKASDGVVFTTYDTLKSSEKIKGVNEKGEKVSTKGKTRLQQIIDWVGEDFDGVIAFDEAHNLGNSMDTKANRGVKKAAAKALAGVALQNALPKARVVYVSATGATEVSNLSYAERLGLWGKGTAFANRDDFLSKVSSGGVAAMELVARDMKALGRYIARNLSYDGVEYDRVEHKLTPEQVQVYDKLATGWQLVLKNFNAAMEAAGITEEKEGGGSKTKNKDAKSAILSQFWGGHQRFFNQVITSMQLPTVLKAVERDIAEGRSAVLQLVNTNEAAQERALAKVKAEGDPEEIEDLDMTPRDQLMQLVSNAFPVNRFEDYTDESGNLRSRMVVDKDNKPVQDPKLVAAREALLDELGSIKVPDGPLEMLLNHFGTDKVSEVTGRKQRVVRKPDEKTGQMRTVVEKRPGSANVAEANLFQEGKKPILVFSEAGGTGVSYHADVNSGSANKRRSHYLVQAGWRADKAVQGFGRTHRTNQASAPLFHLVTTDLQGQKRFISSIARRLGQLGALTKGERRTGNQGMFGLRDNLESDEARDALKAFYNDVVADKIPGVSVTDLQDQMGLKILEEGTGRLLQQLPPMPQFLNRMLSLKTDLQNHVFNAFSARLDDVIDRAAAAGTLDTGVETYTADRIRKVGDQKVYTDQESGAETRHVHLVTETRNKPATYEQVVSRLRSANASKDAPFIRSKRSGKIFGVADSTDYTDKEGRIIEQKKLLGPLGYEFADSYKLNNEQYWEPVEDAKAEAAWGDQVKKIPEFAQADLHLITGAVLPIWDRLGGSPKIFRLQTDAGERMLGRVIPNDTVPATLKALGAEALKVNVAPAEMATAILDNGKRAELANGWVIKRSLVAGEPRLELVGPDYQFADQLKRDGVFSERIDWKTRFFIPTGEAAAVIERVTKGRPVTELSSGAAEKEEGSRFQRHAPGFFSTLNRAIDEVKLTRAPAKDWLGLIGNLVQKGVKKEELDWSGVRDWLAGQQGTVTKEAVQQHLRENEVQVQEVEKGAATRFTTEDVAALHDTLLAIEQNGDLGKGAADELMNGIERGEAGPIGEAEELGVPDEFISPFRDQDGGPTKFGTGQGKPLPGGENYRELLLTLPSPSWMYAWRRDAPSAEAMAKVFTSGHWHEPNVLAHVRFDTRTGPKGEKILHIAEVQSDWHQKGRKGGYAEKVTKDVAEQRGYSVYRAKSNLGTDAYFAKGPEFPRGVIPVNGHDTEAMAWDRLISSLQAYNDKSSVPNAPFKSSWHELAMKRMLRYAAENGYDKVTWDTGDTNTDRYDLAHVVDKIEVHPAGADHPGELLVQARKGGQLVAQQYTRPEKLADFIGKDAADRALSGGNKKRLDNGEAAILTGDDLKVGGKGMREFYDKILPQFMNKYAKKWGASVGEAKIPSAEAYWEPFQRADGKWSFRQKEGGAESAESFPTREAVVQALGKPVHSIDVTPAMREGVMKGQPLFQRERLAGERGQAPGTVRLAQDVVATLPHAPSPEEQSVIDQVGRIARQIVPKAEVVATRRLYAQGALAQGGEHDIAGATTRGARRLIAWSLASRDAAGTLRHEAIHWLKQNGFFHAKEWGVLERAAQTGNWMGKHNIMERYPDLGFEGQIEEAIAEQFAKWRQAPAGVPQVAKPLFERLAVLLGRVRDYLRQAFGHDTDADNVFSRIASGEVGSRTPPPPAPNRPPGSRETFGMSRFQEMEPEERDSRIAEGARALINVAEDLQMAIAPMARGSDTTKATVKDFSNLMRAARDFGLVQIDRLKKQFKPSQLKAMWEAADEQSIAAQQNRTPREGGLARLNDQERTAVADLQKDAQSVWNAMREAGQIEGEGIPHYVPHLYVEVGETGYKRLGSRGLRSIPGLGRNVTTTSPHLLHRKYLTAEEGVEAAAHKFGVTTAIVKDIRTLPMTTMRNREALAGYQLIQEIKNMGQRVGEDWVAEGSTPPGFFHVDHPAFYRWRPAFVTDEASGRVVPAKDQNGNMMWQKVPLSVREDWEGPLRAALTEPEGPVYRAFMDLKMRAMNNIMFSPLVQLHLLTELGRAFPAAPFKIASMKLMFEGNQAKNDQALRLRAVMAGLVPIGHRGAMQDITSVTSADNIRPGRSWTAQILGAVPGLFDVRAGDAVKRGIDRMGDLLHNTLLWDRVQDLQFGLFTTLSDWGRAKGLSQETADRMAAHMANRYAGTLPRESMSVFARKLSNELLFSRTYTLGNMGMMKDALGGFLGAPVQVVGRAVGRPDIGKGWGGLPMDIQAQIKRDAPEELAKVQGIARRKALSMLVLDVALMNVGMALVQNFFQWMSGESGDEIAKGYVARWQELEADAARNPFMVLNPIHDMMRLSPVFENERDPDTGLPLQRIFVGYDKQGTAIYARNPLGKYAEEIVGWTESPLVTLKSKLNALAVKPTLDVLANDRGFGRKVYLPTDNAAVIAAKIFAHYIEATLPMQQIDATRDLLMGKAKSTDAAQLLGRTVGVTFRHGAPGGPAVGLMYQVRAVHEAKVQEALPEIRQKIIDGKLEDARRDMQALGIPFGLQRYYIRTARNPNARLSAHAIRDFMRYASPEERAQMQRLRGANQ